MAPLQFKLACPLCGHDVEVPRDAGDSCEYCGAQLDAFAEAKAAHTFAEEMKARGESAHAAKAVNGDLWVVAHKSLPTNRR